MQTRRQIHVMSCSAAAEGMAKDWRKHSRGLATSWAQVSGLLGVGGLSPL